MNKVRRRANSSLILGRSPLLALLALLAMVTLLSASAAEGMTLGATKPAPNFIGLKLWATPDLASPGAAVEYRLQITLGSARSKATLESALDRGLA